jgi:hypothetical protein
MPEFTLQKGSRIRAKWFEADPFGKAALTGMQIKTTATASSVTGTVRHIRSNDPNFAPENSMLFVEPDDGIGTPCAKCGVNEVQIKPAWIVEVIIQNDKEHT